MEITKLTHSFKIENNGNVTQHGFNSITAYISKDKDSITFKEGSKNIATAPIKNIKINGQQVTTDNIENLLEEMFLISSSNGGSGGSTLDQIQADWLNDDSKSASYINNKPHSIIKNSKDLKLPNPVCAGHIVEVMEQDKLYRAYQWNGWNWSLIGAKPNFIYTPSNNENTMRYEKYEDMVTFYKREDNTTYLTFEENKAYEDSIIQALKIDLVSKDYTLGTVCINKPISGGDIIIPPLKAFNLVIQKYDQEIYGKVGTYGKIQISDCEIERIVTDLDAKDYIVTNNTSLSTRSFISCDCTTLNAKIENNPYSFNIIMGLGNPGQNLDKQTTSTLEIINNGKEDSKSRINIFSINTKNYGINGNLTIRDNKNLTDLIIESFNRKSEISSFNVDFDNSISRVDISNSIFSEPALTSLIKALVNVPDNENKDYARNFKYKNSTPKLTDEQKTQLQNAGWKIEE